MDEEVGISLKIGITVIMTAVALATAVNIWYNSSALLATTQNASTNAVSSVSTQNIVRLSREDRRYVDLYKTYEYYEEYINSIYGIDSSGVSHINYLRNADNVNDDNPLKSKLSSTSYSGIVNLDNMYSNFLNEYCDEEHSDIWIKVMIYPDKLGTAYDIYYEELDR